jgi:hypothetical protein
MRSPAMCQEPSGTTHTANLLSGGIDEVFTRTDSNGNWEFPHGPLGSTLALDGPGCQHAGSVLLRAVPDSEKPDCFWLNYLSDLGFSLEDVRNDKDFGI